MNNILEKQAAITNKRREKLVGLIRGIGYQYTLPKEVDGLFSVYAVRFAVSNGKPDFDKPLKSVLCFLIEEKLDLPEIKRRIADRKKRMTSLCDIEYWVCEDKVGTIKARKVA